MKKTVLALAIIATGLASCSKEPQQLSKQQIKQKIDSITTARIKESDMQSQVDLQRRIKIEVKAKADSIVAAQSRPKDSVVAHPRVPVRPGMFPHIPGKK